MSVLFDKRRRGKLGVRGGGGGGGGGLHFFEGWRSFQMDGKNAFSKRGPDL